MKHIYTLTICLLLALTTQAARTVIVFNAIVGNWSIASNWNLNRIPQDGDSIVIPFGDVATLDKNQNLNDDYVKVAGVLTIAKKLRLTGASIVEVTATGTIEAGANNRNTEIIEINGVNKYDQRSSLLIAGPAFANDNSGVAPNGFSGRLLLPVVYASFYANKNNNNVVLTWSTSQETGNREFEVQRSNDGANWTIIGVVKGAGNSSLTEQYSFTDKGLTSAVGYYRIRQVDDNGNYTYSVIKTVHLDVTAPVTKIYAGNKTLNVEFNQEIKNPVVIRLVNLNGQVISEQKVQKAAYRLTMNMNNCQSGVYVVNVSDGQSINESVKVIL